MTTDSYLELVLVFIGWLINNALWIIITTTGIFAIPLAFKIVGVWLKVREEGDDEGNKGTLALPRMEHILYVAFVVMMFCAMPVWDVDISTMRFDKTRSSQCGVNVPKPEESGYGPLIAEFKGQVVKIPLWWYLVHSLSKGVTHAAIASIPCGNDFRLLRFEVQHTRLNDPIIRQEVQEFATQCYAKSYYRLKYSNPKLTAATIDSVSWIGSDYFLNTEGYYDYYTSTLPRAAWPYSESRDSGYSDVGRGGYPTCKDWWSASSKGLKSRLLESFHPKLINKMKKQSENWEENLLRWLVSPKSIKLSGSGDTYMMGNQRGQETGTGFGAWIKRTLSALGLLSAQVTKLPAFDALRQALPMVHAVLLMALVISIPLVMLVGAYEPKVVVTITFSMFALIFVPFWWELGGWLDDRLITLINNSYLKRNSAGFFIGGSGSDSNAMNLVLGAMYVVLPVFWFGAVSWSGVKIGGVVSSAMGKSSAESQQAGSQGSGLVKTAVTTAVTKGKGVLKK